MHEYHVLHQSERGRVLTQERDEHPAEAIGKALIRSTSILTAISTNFVDRSGQFAVNEPFVAQAVRAVEGLLAQATDELARLYEDVDLRWKSETDPVAFPMAQAARPVADQEKEEVQLSARTYDELLRKLTAAEVFAADISESENDLLPLLNNIKVELQRSRKSA
jgi:hypothetical protein